MKPQLHNLPVQVLWITGLLLCQASHLSAQNPAVQAQTANHSSGGTIALPNDPVVKALAQDATLRSIAYVTEDRLVAVGDRGTILSTHDAGRNWQLVASPTSVNLQDVQFVGQTGLAVGGWIGKESGISCAAILKSNDGGNTWEILTAERLPRLTGLMIQPDRWLCWGDYSPELRSSVFQSRDGGLSWQSAAGGLSQVNGATTSAAGQLAVVNGRGQMAIEPKSIPQQVSSRHEPLRAITAIGAGWLAAGHNGRLVHSLDGWLWSDVMLPIDRTARQFCCWNTIARHGEHIWVGGSPGSLILHSADKGVSWQVLPTGQNHNLNKLVFVDHKRGWAVGAAGIILATRDGGRSWYHQRHQPGRCALLTIAQSPESTAWLGLASTIWDQRRSCAAISLTSQPTYMESRSSTSRPNMATQAITQLGAAEHDLCDLSQDDLDTAIFRLALKIACWRPDVVLTFHSASGNKSISNAERTTVMAAVSLASDDRFQSMVSSLHVRPWRVGKLVTEVSTAPALSATASSGSGQYSEQAQRVMRETGLALWDTLLGLPSEDRLQAQRLNMRTLWSVSQNRSSQTDLLGGVADYPETRLTSQLKSMGNYQLVMGRAHRDRIAEQLIIDRPELQHSESWQNECRFYCQSLPVRESSDAISRLVNGLLQHQQWHRGIWVLEQAIAAYPREDLALWANLQLLQLLGSAELEHWRPADKASFETNLPTIKQASHEGSGSGQVATALYEDDRTSSPFVESSESRPTRQPSRSSGTEVVVASAQQPLEDSSKLDQDARYDPTRSTGQRSRHWLKRAESAFRQYPTLRSQPSVIMQLAAHLNNANHHVSHQSVLTELVDQPGLDGWHQAARQEMTLLQGQASQLPWLARATVTQAAPVLDGQLAEPLWQANQMIQLSGAESSAKIDPEIRWAYDNDFLYLAIWCPREDNQPSKASATQRTHDADLQLLDHVEVSLDIDRDYATAYQFAVAENGLTSDRCMNLSGYNPKWYRCVAQSDTHWCAEIAIPLESLTGEIPRAGQVWAISARRVRQGKMQQNWPQKLSSGPISSPCGLLVFE
jgi:photosystem II stability/assembly factor-like uncharacterized protein